MWGKQYFTKELISRGALTINDGYRAKNSELSDKGIPFARAGNVNNGFDFSDADKFPRNDLHKVGAKKSLPGDVVFTSKGTVGRFAYVKEDTQEFVYSPQLCFWRSENKDVINPRWLYYWMNSFEFKTQVYGVSNKTDMAAYVSLGDQRAMSMPLPKIQDQQAIAHILGTLDDKIELNRRMNETLEAMARAMFKAWFVDFEGHTEFEDSELGPIPKGWRVGAIKDTFHLTMGQSPPGSSYNETGDGLPFFQGRRDFGFRFPSKRIFCTEPKRIANSLDTLISVRAPVGDVNMAKENCCIGRGLASARHFSGSIAYTYYFMKSLHRMFNSYNGEGTVFGSINKKDFLNLKHVMPPQPVVAEFDNVISPLDSKLRSNEEQTQVLISIRDLLLPKLISGEIRVNEAEGMVEEAV